MYKPHEYILRIRPKGKKQDEYVPINKFDIICYKCGLKPGDKVELLNDILIDNSKDRATEDKYFKGEIWTVLIGSSQDPNTLWFRRPDGNEHSWDDNKDIFKTFKLISTGH